MSRAIDDLEAEAMELSRRDRAALVHRLILSLDEGADDDPTEVELAWEQEIRHRLDAYRRGEVKSVPAEDVFTNARLRPLVHKYPHPAC